MASPDPQSPRTPVWRRLLENVFSLDVRSLALFRVVLAVIILTDILTRFHFLQAHYSDAGVMPRQFVPLHNQPISIHLFDGSEWYQALLFYVAGFAALALLVGWQTKYANAVLWFLTISLHARNPIVFHGGDMVLRLLLFWGLFLPLGACWSVDAMSRPSPPRRVLSLGTAALIWQICLLYWLAAVLKFDPVWRSEGYATHMAMSISHFQTRFAQWLLPHRELLQAMTSFALIQEGFVPFLLFIPWKTWAFRLIAISTFIAFHIGLGLCLELGIFPVVCCAAWLALLPTEFWDWLAARLRRPARNGLELIYDPENGPAWEATRFWTTLLMLRDVPVRSTAEVPDRADEVRRRGGWLVVDGAGQVHAGGNGLRLLVQASPVFWPAGLVLRWQALTNPLDWLAGSRSSTPGEVIPRPRPDRPSLVQPLGGLTNLLLAALMVYIFLLNVDTWREPLNGESQPRSWNRTHIVVGNSWLWEKLQEARNAVQAHLPPQLGSLAQALGLTQDWKLFAPWPTTLHGWIVVPGTLEDGSTVDLLEYGWRGRERPVDWSRPDLISAMYPDTMWRKYIISLIDLNPDNYHLRHEFLAYLAEVWNADHADRPLVSASIYHLGEATQPDYQPMVRHTSRICRLDCRAADLRDPAAADIRVAELDTAGAWGFSCLVATGALGQGLSPAAPLGPVVQMPVTIHTIDVNLLP